MSVEKVYSKEAKDSIVDDKYVLANINNKKIRLLFDTGSTSSALNSTNLIKEGDVLNDDNLSVLKNVKGVEGNSMKLLRFKTDSFSTNLISSKNVKLLIFDKQVTSKCSKLGYDGIIGLDMYSESNYPILIDYLNRNISVIQVEDIEKRGFIELNSKFGHDRIYINSIIGDKEIMLHFDTGNSGFVTISDDILNSNPILETESAFLTANNNIKYTKSLHFLEKQINIGNIKINDALITYVPDLKYNGIGIQYIKRYNWIIDFNNKKLYAKPILIQANVDAYVSKLKKSKHKVVEINGDLIVAHKHSVYKEYALGDKIISVNGDIVTSENICKKMQILNDSSNWSILNIIVE